MNNSADPRIIARALDFETNENIEFIDTGAIFCPDQKTPITPPRLGRSKIAVSRSVESPCYNHPAGFIVAHTYPNIALAIEPVAWHATGAEWLCFPVAGIRFEYLDDGSVKTELYISHGSLSDAGAWNFLSCPPRAEAFAMSPDILSRRRQIPVVAAHKLWPRMAHIADTVRQALLNCEEWAIPELAQPCDDFEAGKQLKSGKARSLARHAMEWLRRGPRGEGGAHK